MQLTLPEEKEHKNGSYCWIRHVADIYFEKKDLKRSILVQNDLILTKHYKAIQKCYTDSNLTELTPVFLT